MINKSQFQFGVVQRVIKQNELYKLIQAMDVFKHSLVHGIKLMLFFGFDIIQKLTLTS